MTICNNCGVELEPLMVACPLCDTLVNRYNIQDGAKTTHENPGLLNPRALQTPELSRPQRKAVWELVSMILILLILVTSLINYIINKEISWSEYPVAVCLIIFSYVSSFAFLNKKRVVQHLFAFVTASAFLLTLDLFTKGNSWPLQLGIPLLFFTYILFVGWYLVFKISKQREINLIAISFLAVALLCLCVDAIVDRYVFNHIRLEWSLIVSACVLPVAAFLLFMHYRMKKGQDLNRTFHM